MPRWFRSNVHEIASDILETEIHDSILSCVEDIMEVDETMQNRILRDSRDAVRLISRKVSVDVDHEFVTSMNKIRDTIKRTNSFVNALVVANGIDPEDTLIKQKVDGKVIETVTLKVVMEDLGEMSKDIDIILSNMRGDDAI